MTTEPKVRGPRPQFDHEEAIRLYTDPSVTLLEVAEKFGVSAPGVYRVIRRKAPHLLGGRRRGFKPTYDTQAAIAMYAKGGVSYDTVGKAFGVSGTLIHNLIKREAPHLRKIAGKVAEGS